MANTIYSQGDKVEYGIKVYYVDTDADKTNLPIRSAKMGSKCYVIEDKKWYILNGSYEWVPFVDAGGSGGSGSPFVPKGSVATVDELPTEDNAIGDLYIVQEDHSEWVWLTSTEEPDGYWEQLGSAILPSDIVAATGQMMAEQATETRENLGAEPKKFVVAVTDDGQDGYTADKTFAEIKAAYIAGKTIVVKNSDMEYTLQTLVYEGSSWGEALFATYSFASFNHFGRMREISVEQDGEHEDWRYDNILLEEKPEVYEYNLSTVTITPEENCIYDCKAAALTSLTISNPPATGSYSIIFTSGSTATSTTFPATILGLEDFAAEANTMYEINVLDNRAVVGKWAVS